MIRSMKKRLTLISLACDPRIPRKAIGYIDDLMNGCTTPHIKKDHIKQLQKYVPEFQFE